MSETGKKTQRRRKKGREADQEPREAADATAEETSSSVSPLLAGLVALVVGIAAGWLIRGASASSGDGAVASPAPSASADGASGEACASWATQICEKVGTSSEACSQAQTVKDLMPGAACETALADLPASVALAKKMVSSCDQLVERLCADLGSETSTCAMVKERTPTFPAAQCKEMLGTYDKVLEELREVEKQNAPLSPELAAKQAKGDRPSFGPDDAKVTVVEYSDFECPYCSQAATVVSGLKEKYGDRVRFVFRQFPLSFHPHADLAAQASLAAHAQGKFWPFHDLLFQNQKALEREALEGYAKEAGLDVAAFAKALDEETYAAAVREDLALGEEVGVSGTPTMMVNRQRVANPTSIEAVSALIDAELEGDG